MARHVTKIKIKCGAPERLTKYNEELNKEIHDYCEMDEKFSPGLGCLTTDGICKYANITVYK